MDNIMENKNLSPGAFRAHAISHTPILINTPPAASNKIEPADAITPPYDPWAEPNQTIPDANLQEFEAPVTGSHRATRILSPSTTLSPTTTLSPPSTLSPVRKRTAVTVTNPDRGLSSHNSIYYVASSDNYHHPSANAASANISYATITTEPTPEYDPSQPRLRQRLNRPHLLRGMTAHMESEYIEMVLALDEISSFWNILAAFFTWILLAGFVLFPGTFQNLHDVVQQQNLGINNAVIVAAVRSITSLPLFVVASACTGVGALGMVWLTWVWHKNYIWVLNKIYIPGFLDSVIGLISTIANIYGTQRGVYTQQSLITVYVLSGCSGFCMIMVIIYALWLIRRIKGKFRTALAAERSRLHDEGLVASDLEALKNKKSKGSKGGVRM